MIITKELLKTIYERVNECAIAKYNKGNPDRIELYAGGCIQIVWTGYDKYDDDTDEILEAEDLIADLDTLVKERNVRIEKERIDRIIRQAAEEKHKKVREKEDRKCTYLKLKKEFE